jgi:hypothetical protein
MLATHDVRLIKLQDIRAAEPLGAAAQAGDSRLEFLLGEWRATRTPLALEAVLHKLATRGARRARVLKIGAGRDGRSMLALELGAVGAPGIVVVPGTVAHEPARAASETQADELYGALDALLDLAQTLVVGPDAARTRVGARLETRRIVVLFGARTDLLAPRLPLPGFDPTRNFPVDWDLAQRSGGGPFPLAIPETAALARWLDAEPRLYATALVGAAPIVAESLALGDDAADREQARLMAGPCVRAAAAGAPDAAPPVHGGFARHARLRMGLAVVAFPVDSRASSGAPESRAGAPLDVVAELLESVPRLELALDPSPRALGIDRTRRPRAARYRHALARTEGGIRWSFHDDWRSW